MKQTRGKCSNSYRTESLLRSSQLLPGRPVVAKKPNGSRETTNLGFYMKPLDFKMLV